MYSYILVHRKLCSTSMCVFDLMEILVCHFRIISWRMLCKHPSIYMGFSSFIRDPASPYLSVCTHNFYSYHISSFNKHGVYDVMVTELENIIIVETRSYSP